MQSIIYHVSEQSVKKTTLSIILTCLFLSTLLFKKILTQGYVLLILEREKKKEREKRDIDVREKHWSVAFCMCPDQELNLQPFDVWDDGLTN